MSLIAAFRSLVARYFPAYYQLRLRIESKNSPDAWNQAWSVCKDSDQPDEARRQALHKMLDLASCYNYAILTMRCARDLRRPDNNDDTEILRQSIAKVKRHAQRVRGLEEAWDYAPNAELKTDILDQMEAIANEDPEQTFDFYLFTVDRLADIVEDEDETTGARNDLIRSIATPEQAHIVLKRLKDHPDLRPNFWQKMPRVLKYCHEALILHHDWFSSDECRIIQQLIRDLRRDGRNCPINYRGICQNRDCPISGAGRRAHQR